MGNEACAGDLQGRVKSVRNRQQFTRLGQTQRQNGNEQEGTKRKRGLKKERRGGFRRRLRNESQLSGLRLGLGHSCKAERQR